MADVTDGTYLHTADRHAGGAQRIAIANCSISWPKSRGELRARRSNPFLQNPHSAVQIRPSPQSLTSNIEQLPKLPHGRPSKRLRKLAQQRTRQEQKLRDLFTHRYLFVQHDLSQSERATWQQITRGLPHVRSLREIMNEVYRLFDQPPRGIFLAAHPGRAAS